MRTPDAFDPGAILDAVQAAIIVIDADGRVVSWNRAAEGMYGYDAASAVGRPLAEMIQPSGQARPALGGFAERQPWTGESLVRRADGTTFTVEATNTPLFDTQGHFAGMVGHSIDITERLRAQEALRDTSTLLHSIIGNAPVVLFATDRAGTITLSEGRGLQALGFAPGELVGTSVYDRYGDLRLSVIGEPGPLLLEAILSRVLAGDTLECSTSAGGIHYDSWFVPRQDPGGVVVGMIGFAIDVTARKQLEEQLHHAQKMEAVGLLAGGVAHDFNNMLTAILGYAELLTAELPPGGHRDDADEICRAATRAARVTSQLLAFTRRQRHEAQPLDVNDIVRDYEQLLRKTVGERISLVLDLSDEPATVLADRGQIEQVVMNVAVNARDAMPAGGVLTITSRLLEQGGFAGARSGRHVALDFTDTGIGMDATTASRIFEPFFTTKGLGRGTGLGLPTVYAVIRQHEGAVWVESDPGHGTTFRIRLPYCSEPVVPVASDGRAVLAGDGPQRTILVAEDEDAVRSLLESVLTRAGYRVLTAASGEAAVALFAGSAESIDLVISDVIMPGMSGPAMVQQVRQVRPDVRVLYISGFSEPDAHDPHDPHLTKPFTAGDLLRRVAELVGP